MANNDYFKFHFHWQEIIDSLSESNKAVLYRAIIEYAKSGSIPELESTVQIVFTIIQKDIDYDNEKSKRISEKRSAAGSKHRGNQYQKKDNQNGTNVPIMNGTNVPDSEKQMIIIDEENGTNGTNVPIIKDDGTSVPNETLAHADNNPARPQINTPTCDNILSKQDIKENTPTKVVVSKKRRNNAAIAATPSNKLESRKSDFYNSLVPFLDKYPKEMLREFYEYWSESNRSMTKMRFEQQPVWELGKRLAAWARNDNKFKQYGSNRKTQQQINDEQRTIAASVVARLMQENKPVN